jgi:hypothetical protein
MNEAVMAYLVETFGPIIASVVSAVLIWVLGELARQVRARTNNDLAVSAIERLTHTAATTVMEIEQVVVPKLKAAARDGKLSEHERKLLMDLAMKKVKERLQPSVKKQAGRAIADMDGFLQAKIEQLVYSMKPPGGCNGPDADR